MPLHSRRDLTSIAFFGLLISTIFIMLVGTGVQSGYAQQAVKTFRIKVQLDKSVVTRGDTQSIEYRVNDGSTGQPVGGAIVRATVTYADGVTVRHFATTTDSSGKATISFQIESNATPGTFAASFEVSAAAYLDESFDKDFTVVPNSVNDDNDHHHHHHHN